MQNATKKTTPECVILLNVETVQQLQAQLKEHETTTSELYVLPPGSRYFPRGLVLRYTLQYWKTDLDTGYVGARQGRYTQHTLAAAEQLLKGMLEVNSADRLSLYGGAKALFVAFTACFPGHYDPAPVDLDSTPIFPAAFDLRTLGRLQEAVWRARRDCPSK